MTAGEDRVRVVVRVGVTGCFWFIINWLSKMIEGRFSPVDEGAASGR